MPSLFEITNTIAVMAVFHTISIEHQQTGEHMATGFLIASGAAAVIYEILAYWNEKDKKNGGD